MSHLMARHPDYPTVHSDALRGSTPAMPVATFVSDTSKALFRWMDLVVTKHLPFSTVEDETFRKYVGLQATTASTLRPTMNDVCFAVKAQIQQQLPVHFGIVLDDWSAGGTSYCCIMTSFCLDDVVKTPMLAFAPMLDKGDHSAAQQVAFIEATLELYSKTLDVITFVIGDNCSVNQRMAGLLNVPLVGCVSLRFNFADHLAAKMDLREFFPAPVEIYAKDSLRTALDIMQGFTLAFQRDDLTLSEARVLMDALCEKFPSMSHHLGPRAAIVKHPDFETAVIKVIKGAVGKLTEVERSALSGFEIATVISPARQRSEASASLAMDILRS
ncbi:hypothetical protein B5M09_013622 [Aphanomyces astaci]|uniref:Uncharacterized protein n=1 Tax=Aphanomyces astaci TaxID=112090 RepID=A0A425DNC3_APHAT|nr:hypothetical protein B5M09_013622 [Aphanomyces astaci]